MQKAATDDLCKAILTKLPSWTMEAAKPVMRALLRSWGTRWMPTIFRRSLLNSRFGEQTEDEKSG